jgi:hypothetical protein
MKRSVFMLSTVALMELLLVLAAVMTVMVVSTAATADTAFAAGARPAIGTSPPGENERNPKAETTNPGAAVENRTVPTTGGQAPRFQE